MQLTKMLRPADAHIDVPGAYIFTNLKELKTLCLVNFHIGKI